MPHGLNGGKSVCCSPFSFCKNIPSVHDCKKDYLSEDCSHGIRRLRQLEELVKRRADATLSKKKNAP